MNNYSIDQDMAAAPTLNYLGILWHWMTHTCLLSHASIYIALLVQLLQPFINSHVSLQLQNTLINVIYCALVGQHQLDN